MNRPTRNALVLLPLLGLALAGCHGGAPDAATKAGPAVSPYATIASGKVDIEGGIIAVAARTSGTVREVLVQEGDAVRRDQVLARLDDREQQLALQTARAAEGQARSQVALLTVYLQAAERELTRLQSLVARGLVARQPVDQAADNVASARAQLDAQRAAIATATAQVAVAEYGQDLTVIRAPLDGRIIRRYANPGAGASTLNVSNMFDLEPEVAHIVRAELDENSIPQVSVGQAVEIAAETDTNMHSTGKVLRIARAFGERKLKSDSAGEATDERVVEVVVSAGDAKYLIGQRVLVKFMKAGHAPGEGDAKPAAAAGGVAAGAKG
jgi:HlyD family secretion protein